MKHLLNISFRLSILFIVPATLLAQTNPLAGDLSYTSSLFIPARNDQDTSLHSRIYLSQPWTLQECIGYAQVHNISVQQQMLNVKFAQASLLQSEGNMLPNVNGFASHTYNNGRTIDPFTNTFATSTVLSENFGIRSSITLFAGMQNVNTYKQNQFSLEANRYQVQQTQYDIGMNVASAYLNVL